MECLGPHNVRNLPGRSGLRTSVPPKEWLSITHSDRTRLNGQLDQHSEACRPGRTPDSAAARTVPRSTSDGRQRRGVAASSLLETVPSASRPSRRSCSICRCVRSVRRPWAKRRPCSRTPRPVSRLMAIVTSGPSQSDGSGRPASCRARVQRSMRRPPRPRTPETAGGGVTAGTGAGAGRASTRFGWLDREGWVVLRRVVIQLMTDDRGVPSRGMAKCLLDHLRGGR